MPVANRIKPFHGNISFHAHHSPMGAYMSFTCGKFYTRGGFGLEMGRPGNQEIFVGVKRGRREEDVPLRCLPFFEGAESHDSARFLVEGAAAGVAVGRRIESYPAGRIRRRYGWASDSWSTPDFTFSIFTPFGPISPTDPPLPAILAELTIDNRRGRSTVTGVFAVRFPDGGLRLLDGPGRGFAWRDRLGVSVELWQWGRSNRKSAEGRMINDQLLQFLRWDPAEALLDANPVHLLGNTAGFGFEVPAGLKRVLVLALGCYVEGVVTTGFRGRYAYTRCQSSLEQVLQEQLRRAASDRRRAAQLDATLERARLNRDQKFLIAHATRSYYGNTQLLEVGGEPFWIVNEGEYCMMNTLDLSVDQVFWELDQNPWVVQNLLDRFVRHYSFVDQIKIPRPGARSAARHQAQFGPESEAQPRVLGAPQPMELFELREGGISFCHDMGAHNQFSPPGSSSYELPDIVGCFSHMTSEQLCNWSLMAACYVHHTTDDDWLRRNHHIIAACLQSLLNRGGRAGFCQYDSARCRTGAEITSYDS
ncbi:MAG: glycoside hydrolase family 52 protein, partial [Phycisphaerae bacterium]|nr:glycoside hydrolase family 52 protein [Phycisphaerae bacterium]